MQECGGGPKWERLLNALSYLQKQYSCSNGVIAFIAKSLHPQFFRDSNESFNAMRKNVNYHLAFYGIKIDERGQVTPITAAKTQSEARQRASELQFELDNRGVHPFVLTFCRPELLEDNYFHAVLEATKSIADKIQDKTGFTEDGADLIDKAFSIKNPVLVINSLRTESEKSEHKGFAHFLKGIFGMFRNVTAHAPKIKWAINKNDALDALMVISYAHKRLDEAHKV